MQTTLVRFLNITKSNYGYLHLDCLINQFRYMMRERLISTSPLRRSQTLKAILPKFNGEVPDDSMIVAAYTLGTYLDKDSIHNISPNIIWVAVLGEATE
jgi:hypothetical protein